MKKDIKKLIIGITTLLGSVTFLCLGIYALFKYIIFA